MSEGMTTGTGAPSAPTSSSTPSESQASSSSASQSGSNVPQGGGSLSSSPKDGTQAASPSSSPEYFEVKVNGKVQKMTRDEVIAHAQMSHAAQARFEEAARARKEAEQIRQMAQKDPISALRAAGLQDDQIRDYMERWYMEKFIEPETLSPEQRRAKEMESKLRKYEEEDKNRKLQSEQQQMEQATAQQREYLQQQIVEAIDRSGLPKTEFIAQRMAFYMRQNLINGWDAPIEVVITAVKNERKKIMADITENTSAESLIDMLGESIINKIRKHDLEQLRQRRQGQPFTGGSSPSAPQTDEKVSYTEVAKRLREMRSGKW
jgi:hypothetical protein